jgi:hypothetical protein
MIMTRFVRTIVCGLALALAASVFAGQAVEIKLKDGSRWRGEVADAIEIRFVQSGVEVPMTGTLTKVDALFIEIEANVAGKKQKRTIFKSDIVTMKTVGKTENAPATAAPTAPAGSAAPTSEGSAASPAPKAVSTDKPVGVIVLPMSGMVGVEMRHEEIERVAKKADELGEGQIIVLLIESGGGLAAEMPEIDKVIREVKKRHRVVAWIKEAISAAAATAIHCDEIYFMPEGVLGAMTMFGGGVSVKDYALEMWLRDAGRYMEEGGRSPFIAYAMIDDEALLSYDIDSTTGEVTWHNDLSGEFVLSDQKQNLVFNASNALHSKFSDGTANTIDDLAKLMNLTKWYEVSDYGRKISAEWQRLCKQANEEIPLLANQYEWKGTGGGDQVEVLGTRIGIIQDLIRWWDRCPNVARMNLPPKEDLEREVAQLRKDLADLRKRQRENK